MDSALKKKPAERGAEVELVAHELRTLTREFYRRVSPQEFSHCNWTKKEASSKSSTIVQYTDYFNKLNDYFIQKILTQKSRDVSNALQLLLQIAQSLCNFEGEQEADLHHLMLMASILNSHRIMRLKQEYMSPADQEICDELDELVSGAGNFNRLRQVTNAFDSSLPFFPGILTDITMGIEGNPELVPKAEQLGAVLIKVFQKNTKISLSYITFAQILRHCWGIISFQMKKNYPMNRICYTLKTKCLI